MLPPRHLLLYLPKGHRMTSIDPTKMDAAKGWADYLNVQRDVYGDIVSEARVAAEVIANLPDHIIDVDKVQEVMEDMAYSLEQNGGPGYDFATARWMSRLEALLPTPKPHTLADLIEQGHDTAQYQWMQAEHRDERCIISRINNHACQTDVSLLTATGSTIWVSPDEVIPLPDLPRLVWPAESRPEPAEEETPEPETPRPEDVPAGEAWLVNTREGEQREALKAGNRWYVKDGDDVEEWVEEALTPIARLVPEVQA